MTQPSLSRELLERYPRLKGRIDVRQRKAT